jgi:hypothetical protein
MADFREVLEVKKNSTCFLSFSFCKTKEDLAVVDEDQLPNPPMEFDWNDCATIGEVADLIDNLSDTSDEASVRIRQLLDTGKTTMIKEY